MTSKEVIRQEQELEYFALRCLGRTIILSSTNKEDEGIVMYGAVTGVEYVDTKPEVCLSCQVGSSTYSLCIAKETVNLEGLGRLRVNEYCEEESPGTNYRIMGG